MTLWVRKGRPNSGDRVKLQFIVENTSDRTVVIQSEEKPGMDIEISIVRGREWHWSDGEEFTPEMKKLELAPGESKNIEWIWVVPEGGIYTAWADGLLLRGRGYDRVPVELCVNGCGKP